MTHGIFSWKVMPISEFPVIRVVWDQLNGQLAKTPILTSEFYSLLLDYFPPREARIGVLERDGEPVSACILERARYGVWNTYQPSQAPLGAFVTVLPEVKDLELKDLLKQLDDVGMVVGLTQLDPYFCNPPIESRAIRMDDYIETACLATTGDFDDYWRARGKNLRQNIRKQRNRLEKAGISTRLEIVTDPGFMTCAVDEFGVLESAGWKAEHGTALHPKNTQGMFYRTLFERYAANGLSRVYRYFFDDALVACDLCLVASGVLIILKTTYSEDYSQYSPAMLMREEQIRSLFADDSVNTIEFYGKALDWHKRLTSNIRTLFHCTIYRWPVVRRIAELPSAIRRQ